MKAILSKWHVGRSSKADAELAILDENGFVVALLGFTGPDEDWVARLIAAAPALLEALRALHAHLRPARFGSCRGCGRAASHTEGCPMAAAEAALALADGEGT